MFKLGLSSHYYETIYLFKFILIIFGVIFQIHEVPIILGFGNLSVLVTSVFL